MLSLSDHDHDHHGDKHMRCWEDIPPDILHSIYHKLLHDNSENDSLLFQKLASVCTSWRSSMITTLRTPTRVHFPLKLPPPPLSICPVSSRADQNITATLSESHIFLFTPPSGHRPIYDYDYNNGSWIVKVGQRSDDECNSWLLENPLGVSCASFEPETLSVNVLDKSVKQIAKSYKLEYVKCHGKPGFAKVVIIWDEDFGSFTALALIEEGRLALWRLGEAGWKTFEGNLGAIFFDIIAFEGKLYATTKLGELMMIDPHTYEVNFVIINDINMKKFILKLSRLLESNGYLYLALQGCPHDAQDKEEFRLVQAVPESDNIIGNKWGWKFVDNYIEDRVFFVSKYVSFSLAVKDLGWFKGNYVLWPFGFKELSFVQFSREANKSKCVKFEDCLKVFTLEDLTKVAGVELVHKFANIFWPPPKWLF